MSGGEGALYVCISRVRVIVSFGLPGWYCSMYLWHLQWVKPTVATHSLWVLIGPFVEGLWGDELEWGYRVPLLTNLWCLRCMENDGALDLDFRATPPARPHTTTQEPRAVTMKLGEPKWKCPKAVVPTHLQTSWSVKSRILKWSVKS